MESDKMKYCVVKNIIGNLTTGVISQGENAEALIEQALVTELNGKFLTENDIKIITEEEFQIRLENQPSLAQTPSAEERLRMAEETILFLMDMNLMGGM